MNKEFVTCQGAPTIKGWPGKTEAPQLDADYSIDGQKVPSVAFGNEEIAWGPGSSAGRSIQLKLVSQHITFR